MISPLELIRLITVVARLLTMLLLARVLFSWYRASTHTRPGEIEQYIYNFTEPMINLMRIFPHRFGMFDISIIYAFFMIDIIAFILIAVIEKSL